MYWLLVFIYSFVASFIVVVLLRFVLWIVRSAVKLALWIVRKGFALLWNVLKWLFFLIVAWVCSRNKVRTE